MSDLKGVGAPWEGVDLGRFNELWRFFLAGLPGSLVMTRTMLCILFLLEELEKDGRDGLKVLESWMVEFDKSRGGSGNIGM